MGGVMQELGESTLDVPDASPFADAPSSSFPVRVDRFVLERELGAGGMGTVYDGWDEQLQRRVALKFMRCLDADPVAEQRMFREAQGLAALSHPNVISVYDVGRHDGRVWIAMEQVPGRTLGAWAAEQPRSRAELLEHWRAAGRGLAAIHAAGLIHRDIKPDNILLGDDGRVRIIDLGLVRGIEQQDGEALMVTVEEGPSRSLTNTGGFVGTPAYASPEQLERRRVDARSDQYAFCVSVWEALCGERPPRRERGRGGLVPVPEGRRLPRRLHRALSRGLALDVDARFPTMDSLLAELAPRRTRWASLSLLGSATVSLATVAGVLATRSAPVDEPGLACVDAGAAVERLWSASERTSFAATLDPEEASYGLAVLDEWVTSWRDAAEQNCRRFRVEERYDAETFGRGEQCLDRRIAELEALLGLGIAQQLAGPGRLVAELGQLEEPATCLDAAVQADQSPLAPSEQLDEIARIRRILAGARARNASASVGERLTTIAALEPELEAIAWSPLIGEAALVVGGLELARGDAAAALTELGRALDIAELNRDTELAADAWSGIVRVSRELEFDAERVRWALARREAVLERHGASAQQRARLEAERGLLLRMEGRFVEAEAALRSADALFERAGASAAWERAAALRDLGNLLTLLGGRSEEARELFTRARALELAGVVRDKQALPSPIARFNEAITEIEAGRLDDALSLLNEALELGTRSYGPRSPVVVNVHLALAKIHDQRGELELARAHAELADRASTVAFGAEHPSRGDVLSALGTIAYREGKGREAAAAFTRALKIAERAQPDPLTLGMSASNLADALHMLGQDRRARELAELARRTLAELSPDHASLVHPLKTLGALELAAGRPREAREALNRALALHEANPGNSVELAEVLWLLAQVEGAAGDESLARARASEAATIYRQLGKPWTQRVAQITAWQEHKARR